MGRRKPVTPPAALVEIFGEVRVLLNATADLPFTWNITSVSFFFKICFPLLVIYV